ncbi:MAG: DUF309 domain-containing protein [Chlamydiota bacterium]|nr:DUF309 domain-containing protein [Chlamydiota bacterium]
METVPYPKEYLEGIEHFNRAEFYESHARFEEIWRKAEGLKKLYYQALIQAAVAIYQLGKQKLRGAMLLYQDSMDRLAKMPDQYMGINVRKFEQQLSLFMNPYRSLLPGDKISVDSTKFPKIHIDG